MRYCLLLGVSSFMLSGCLGRIAKNLADREVYPIIKDKQEEALGDSRKFTLEPKTDELTERVLSEAGTSSDEFTTEGLRINLAEVLTLAVRNSRIYKNEKESLYLAALALTAERHEFSPIFTGAITNTWRRTPVNDEFGEVADYSRTGTLVYDIGLSKVIAATGARISVGMVTSFTRLYSAPPTEASTGLVSGSIVQPLLRGAGMRVATENLKQAERDVIYSVREFSRFEKDFIVDRIEEYFRLLQQLDEVGNELRAYENFKTGRERNEALSEAGRLDIFQLDQSRQQELNARNRWISAQTDFVQQLDRLKINLGIPTQLKIFPDERDLENLREGSIDALPLTSTEAVQIALASRLDHQTAANRVEDSERRIYLAGNALLPDLDVAASGSIPNEEINNVRDYEVERATYEVEASLELPLDRKSERNAYRVALINRDRAERNFELSSDSIALEVRSSYQNLTESRESYDIQKQSVVVAQRRVDSTTMLQQAGRATVRDALESEEDLRDASNALTRTVIDYTLAQLRFLVALEALEIDDQGMWAETLEEMRVTHATTD